MTSERSFVTTEDWSRRRSGMLECICGTFFIVSHRVWERAAQSPWPIRFAVSTLENTFGAITQPLLQTMESQTLQLFGFFDNQLVFVEDLLEASAFIVLKAFQKARQLPRAPGIALHAFHSATLHLERRGLVGSTSDLWVHNEHIISSKLEDFLHFIEKFPGGKVIVENLLVLGSPLAERLSTWFLANSEAKDKHLVMRTDGTTLPDENFDTHKLEEYDSSDSASKQLSDDNPPAHSPQYHTSDHSLNVLPSSEATESKEAAEKLALVPEKENAVSSQPTEYSSDEAKLSAAHHDEHDPLIHLFESSWSLRPPSLKKR